MLDAILKKLAAYLVAELLDHADEIANVLVAKLLPQIPNLAEQVVNQLTDAIPGTWDDELIDTLASKLPKLIVDQIRAMLPGFLR
ncbi:hypothetical protein [Mycolicibacterium peregrinum]|uniref:hypothetical protein n=1 Tax=Mycolicibacterium peregrinum TaxID=43304 RepID=UPI003AAAF488